MAPRQMYIWFAVALLTTLITFEPQNAGALPRIGAILYAQQPLVVPVFRGGGGHRGGGGFRGGHRGGGGRWHFHGNRTVGHGHNFNRQAGRTSRYYGAWRHQGSGHNPYPRYGRWRHPGEGTGQRNTGWRYRGWRHPGEGNTRIVREYPPRLPGQWGTRFPRRPPEGGSNGNWGGNLWNVPRIGPPASNEPDLPQGARATILGAGGINRPPIAPRFTGAAGQTPAGVAAALLNNKRHRPRELLVEVRADAPNGLKERFAREYEVEVREVGFIDLARVRIWHLTLTPGQNLRDLLIALLQDPRVITAQPNYIYTPVQGAPTERRSGQGAGADPASAGAAWHPTAGAGIRVAIIDTCLEDNHNELLGAVTSSYNATERASPSCQPANHGTAVASLIAGHASLHGTAAGASLLAAQAFTLTAEENEVAATSREIALAMSWAAKAGAQVANLSFPAPPIR